MTVSDFRNGKEGKSYQAVWNINDCMCMQEAAWGEPWILFSPGAARTGVAVGEEPKKHQAKEGKESKLNYLAS
jgi:hypothetical protein